MFSVQRAMFLISDMYEYIYTYMYDNIIFLQLET